MAGDLLSEPALAAALMTAGALVAVRFSSMTAARRPGSWQRPGAQGRSAAYDQTRPLGPGTITARLNPAARGPNVLEVTLLDGERQPLEPLEPPRVSLTLRREDGSIGPLSHAVSTTGAGQYQSNVDFPLDGPWVVEIAVRVSKFEEPIVKFSVEIP